MSFEQSKFALPLGRAAFSVYADSTSQIGTADTDTKITFNTERWDTNNNFNTSTSTFTPTIAGYYLLDVTATFTSLNSGSLAFYKNNALHKRATTRNSKYLFWGSSVMFFNGSTDNAHVVMNLSAPAGTINDAEPYNWFTGYLISS